MAEIRTKSQNEIELNHIIDKTNALLATLRAEGLRITGAYLYGSYVTGAAHADSDIDVAIISPDLTGDRVQDWLRLTLTAIKLDTRFEVIGFRPEQFRDEHPLAWEIKRTGIRIN